MENYFAYFGVPVRFFPDEARIREKYMQEDIRLQPDFHNMEDPEEQMEQLDAASFNQEAYETVTDYDYRMEHILLLQGALAEDWDEQLGPERYHFLEKWSHRLKGVPQEEVEDRVEAWINELDDQVFPLLEDHDRGDRAPRLWQAIAEYFLTRQFLIAQISPEEEEK